MKKENESPPAEADAELAALAAENRELREAMRMHAARESLIGKLRTAGARSPGLLFDSIKNELQFGENGDAVNIAAIAAKLQSDFPEQFGFEAPAASIDGGAGINQPPRLTKDALAKMTASEIAALDWNDVRQTLRS